MKTPSIPEAASNLAAVLAQAIASEEISIRSGDSLVALRQLQQEARLSPAEARRHLEEVRAERLAAG